MDERKRQQIKIAQILQDLGIDENLIEAITTVKKEEYK